MHIKREQLKSARTPQPSFEVLLSIGRNGTSKSSTVGHWTYSVAVLFYSSCFFTILFNLFLAKAQVSNNLLWFETKSFRNYSLRNQSLSLVCRTTHSSHSSSAIALIQKETKKEFANKSQFQLSCISSHN